ncbi:MAG: phosphoenolpyruvate carboxykinase (GTP) [Bradymonadia bacterium]|jgi:phosphoenolpyruvate carboxykinase (GTP)
MIDEKSAALLKALNNPRVEALVDAYVQLCAPAKVVVIDDSPEAVRHIREIAIESGEEHPLAMKGHTYHFDGPKDQARDKEHTRILLSKPIDFGFQTETLDRSEGISEIKDLMRNIMRDKTMYVRFFCLGPTNSEFAIKALQLTDSAYVAHSEDLLYRRGYEEFKRSSSPEDFFFFVHSAGELENGVVKNIDKRRIYIDLDEESVFTINNQYAGNSVGLKKLAFRLAIARAHKAGWLAEHMFLLGVNGPNARKSYFAGAFPSACGKTSTAMIPGQNMVGDDIIYAKKRDGVIYAVNVEKGVFGIIENVNAEDDPAIFKALTSEGEIIFSNVLISKDKVPYWLGSQVEPPAEGGLHYTGYWKPGDLDANAKPIPVSHKNARYTVGMESLPNTDPMLHSPEGVPLSAIVYGGRDSDTSVPVLEAFSWEHGVLLGACVESETTAATLGKEGVRVHNPFANLDFITLPLAKYVQNHLDFAKDLHQIPKVFVTNYFLKNEAGKFTNHKLDKKIWILWAEGRVHGDYDAIETSVGFIPKHEDLKKLFLEHLNKDYSLKDYETQFKIRSDKYLQKWQRMQKAFADIAMPKTFRDELNAQLSRLT